MTIPSIIRLFQVCQGRYDPTLHPAFSGEEVNWIIDSGFGPPLWSAQSDHPELIHAEDRTTVKSAELSAFMLSATLFETLDEILQQASLAGIEITLLKGASVARHLYPHSHWRMMRDLDLLVKQREQSRLEDLLSSMRYSQQAKQSAEFFEQHHHSMPFYSESRSCWVEVHTALFRKDSPLAQAKAFRPENLAKDQRISLHHENATYKRLSDETEFLYTIAHWGSKLTLVGGMVPMLDIILMMKHRGDTLNWDQIIELCDDEEIARYAWLLLSYLQDYEFFRIPSEASNALEKGRHSIGRTGSRHLFGLIDNFMAGGKITGGLNSEAMLNQRWNTLLSNGHASRKLLKMYWRSIFPKREYGRYSPTTHWKRVQRHWMTRNNQQ